MMTDELLLFLDRVEMANELAGKRDEEWARNFRNALPFVGLRLAPPGTAKAEGIPDDQWCVAPIPLMGEDTWNRCSELINVDTPVAL